MNDYSLFRLSSLERAIILLPVFVHRNWDEANSHSLLDTGQPHKVGIRHVGFGLFDRVLVSEKQGGSKCPS
jgi:hypothetical protein